MLAVVQNGTEMLRKGGKRKVQMTCKVPIEKHPTDTSNNMSGSFGTEPGTGNWTVLELEPTELAIQSEPDEPEPIVGSLKFLVFFLYF